MSCISSSISRGQTVSVMKSRLIDCLTLKMDYFGSVCFRDWRQLVWGLLFFVGSGEMGCPFVVGCWWIGFAPISSLPDNSRKIFHLNWRYFSCFSLVFCARLRKRIYGIEAGIWPLLAPWSPGDWWATVVLGIRINFD